MRGLNGVRMVVKQFFFETARLFFRNLALTSIQKKGSVGSPEYQLRLSLHPVSTKKPQGPAKCSRLIDRV